MGEQNTPSGWFPQTDGRLRYWDGTQWTDQFQDAPSPGAAAVEAPAPKGEKNWFLRHKILTGLGAALVLFASAGLPGGCEDVDEKASPAASAPAASSPAASSPAASAPATARETTTSKKPSPRAAESGEDVRPALAEGAGAKTTDAACIDGVTWMCNIEYAKLRGGVVEVRVRTTAPGVTGDDVARSAYNFLTLGSEMNIIMVQVTTAQDGAIGSFKGNY